MYWRAAAVNAEGQVAEAALGNGIGTTRTYDPATGLIRTIQSGIGDSAAVQDLGYAFDSLGNLTSREDFIQGVYERFNYDGGGGYDWSSYPPVHHDPVGGGYGGSTDWTTGNTAGGYGGSTDWTAGNTAGGYGGPTDWTTGNTAGGYGGPTDWTSGNTAIGGSFEDALLGSDVAQLGPWAIDDPTTVEARIAATAAVGGTAAGAYGRQYNEEANRQRQRGRYGSQHEAARSILDEVNPLSIFVDREYGGLVYQAPDGTYSVTPPIRGTIDSVDPGAATRVGIPSGSRMTAYYHTHGAYNPTFVKDGIDYSERFSGIPGDIGYASHFKIDAYLATPSGAFKYYDNRSRIKTPLGRVRTLQWSF